VSAYISGYISKMDKMNNESWKDAIRDLDNDLRNVVAEKGGMQLLLQMSLNR